MSHDLAMGFTLPWLAGRDDRPVEDHVVFLRGATWADYERILEIRGDRSAPRISYSDGVLEIVKIHGSEVLPDLDLAELVSFLDRATTFDAVKDYRAALAGG